MDIKSRTPISDILSDDKNRHILDSTDKIIRWINFQFEEQEIKHEKEPEIPFHRYIDLSNCIICTQKTTDGNPILTNLFELAGEIDCVANTYVDYPHKTSFHQEVLEEIICHNSIIYGAFFHCTKFHKRIYFLNTIINGGNFSRCEFLGDVFIHKCHLTFGSFDGSIFHKSAYFSQSEFNHFQINFHGCVFMDDINLNNVKFVDILNTELLTHSKIDFSNSTFHKNISLNNVELPTHCWFEECNFNQAIILQDITSKYVISFFGSVVQDRFSLTVTKDGCKNAIKELRIDHLKIFGRFDIEDCQIELLRANFANLQDKGILRLFRNTISICDMDSICNRGIIIIEENNLSNIILDSAINVGIIELENTDIGVENIKSRKTARILKDSAYKSNNIIDGLKYRALELDIHMSEKSLPLYDKVILYLNKYSNNYDRNFIYGVLFTMGSAVIFFWIINYLGTNYQIFELNFRFDFKGFGQIWKSYLDILNVLNFRDKLNGVELNAFGETMFLLAKIVIAYGMYQTIAAFRKYRKNI